MQIAGWMGRALRAALVVCLAAGSAAAQGVTTGSMGGVVTDAQGAVVPGATVIAIHEPSGTSYEAVTQADGRFAILGMRVGGPYKVTAELAGFGTQTKDALSVTLGTSTDIDFTLSVAAVTEQVTVKGTSDATFGSQRTGASTAVTRAELALLPTVSGRINDITRLTPQYSGNGVVRRRRQPDEQHHGRRLLLQQLVRSAGSARRPHRRRADLARGRRADPGERRAL